MKSSVLTTFLSAWSNTGEKELPMTARIELLELSFLRLNYSIHAVQFVAMAFTLMLVYGKSNIINMTSWLAAYVVFAYVTRHIFHKFKKFCVQNFKETTFDSWGVKVRCIALLHGLGLTIGLVLTIGENYDVRMLMLITLAAITALNATHQTARIDIFLRFFLSGWCLQTIMMPVVFPQQALFVTPLVFLYLFGMARYANFAHGLFIEHIKLQEHSKLLATSYREARDTAEVALKDKNLFLATASHDLRQPAHAINLIAASLQLMNKNSDVSTLVSDLQHSAHSLNLMLDSLLDLTRLENGSHSINSLPVSMSELLQETQKIFSGLAASRMLDIRIWHPKIDVWVLADPVMLRQILANLVHNALRYSKQGGVLLSIRKRDGKWLLQVWDTGIGLVQQDYNSLFSPYFRSENAWQFDKAGHGLGLSVVARCAELMDFPYGFNSRAGKGSCFWLTLPTSNYLPNTSTSNIVEIESLQLSGRCLVLEDDLQICNALCILLKNWGLTVQTASCGSEVMSMIETGYSPDILLFDQRLNSGESGFQIMSEVIRTVSVVSAIIISGEYNSEELLQAEDEGYLVLRKPVDTNELLAVIIHLLTTPNRQYKPL